MSPDLLQPVQPPAAEATMLPPELMTKAEWHQSLEASVEYAQQNGTPLSAIILDLNYFKEVNDSLGHVRGDQVIAGVKQVVAGALRTSKTADDEAEDRRDSVTIDAIYPVDTLGPEVEPLAGHIGGDEIAIAANTDEAGVAAIVARVRQAFEKYLNQDENADLKRLGHGGIGMALGAATLEPGMTKSDLLGLADEAMYRDKLAQMPELTCEQQLGIEASRVLLGGLGLRLRDLHKYIEILDGQAPAEQELPFPAEQA